MKTSAQRFLPLILLGIAALFLPACGGSGNVKSQKAPETVLNGDTTTTSSSSGTADIGMPGENTPVNTYEAKIGARKRSNSTASTSSTLSSTPAATTQSTPDQTPAMEAAAPPKKSGGSHWLLWLLLAIVVAGGAWYFWSQKQAEDSSQPMPPVGGLSPVSGFTGVKDHIEDETQAETSFWSKKLF